MYFAGSSGKCESGPGDSKPLCQRNQPQHGWNLSPLGSFPLDCASTQAIGLPDPNFQEEPKSRQHGERNPEREQTKNRRPRVPATAAHKSEHGQPHKERQRADQERIVAPRRRQIAVQQLVRRPPRPTARTIPPCQLVEQARRKKSVLHRVEEKQDRHRHNHAEPDERSAGLRPGVLEFTLQRVPRTS